MDGDYLVGAESVRLSQFPGEILKFSLWNSRSFAVFGRIG